jgi:hypothetical protein
LANFLIVEPFDFLQNELRKYFSDITNSSTIKINTTQCDTFQQAIELLKIDHKQFHCAVIVWPVKTNDVADELFALLNTSHFKSLILILLVQKKSLPSVSNWCALRELSDALSWEDYHKIIPVYDCLTIQAKVLAKNLEHEDVLVDQEIIKVLLVDDSPTVRVGFRKILIANGYEVETASSVSEAYELASVHPLMAYF